MFGEDRGGRTGVVKSALGSVVIPGNIFGSSERRGNNRRRCRNWDIVLLLSLRLLLSRWDILRFYLFSHRTLILARLRIAIHLRFHWLRRHVVPGQPRTGIADGLPQPRDITLLLLHLLEHDSLQRPA